MEKEDFETCVNDFKSALAIFQALLPVLSPPCAMLFTRAVPSTPCPCFLSSSAAGVFRRERSHLLLRIPQANDRREASLHFKMALALQFMDEPEDGLAHCQQALGMMESKLDELKSLGASLLGPPCCCGL